MTERICKIVPWPVNRLCKNVTKLIYVLNPTKVAVEKRLSTINNQIANIKSNAIPAAQRAARLASKSIADLDAKRQSVQDQLDHKTLHLADDAARADLKLKAKALGEARKIVADARRADNRVKGYLCVWKKQGKCTA